MVHSMKVLKESCLMCGLKVDLIRWKMLNSICSDPMKLAVTGDLRDVYYVTASELLSDARQ